MIKVDTSLFDWDSIEAIYKEEGIVSQELHNNISRYLSEVNKNAIVERLLELWFFDEHNAISDDKISQFLLSTELTQKINEYFERICDYYWRNSCLSSVLIRWASIKQEVLSTNDRVMRKEKIIQIITDSNVCMFEGIDATDLKTEPRNGSVFANKKKIAKISIKYEKEIDEVRSELSKIFNYDLFAPKFRHQLLKAMHVRVCPYCNRQYITTYMESDSRRSKSTADVDHFYNKANYPFLALCLYNFVPSCPICNSRFKLQKDFFLDPHTYPYERGFGADGIFKLSNLDVLLGNTSENEQIFEIVSPNHDKEVEKSIETFHLNEVYQSHKDYVEELIVKAKVYSDKQLREYMINFKNLFSGEEEMKNILYGTYLQPSDLGKRPLAKLALDILNDLGVNLE